MQQSFEWDEEKAKASLRKHGVGFDEAATVFADPFSLTVPDPAYSRHEQRYVDIGGSGRGRVLVVVYAERGANIRIISCRKATLSERRLYEEGHE